MRQFRMTTRRWMIAVAVVAVAMSGIVAVRSVWQYYVALDRIQHHEASEAWCRYLLETVEPGLREEVVNRLDWIEEQRKITANVRLYEDMKAAMDEYLRQVALLHGKLKYHVAMARKYRRVARFPWLPVEPDPPDPGP